MKWRKTKIAIAAVVIILVITNPSEKEYENYLQANTECIRLHENGRVTYYGLFSIFKYKCTGKQYLSYDATKSGRHLGVFKNFYELD